MADEVLHQLQDADRDSLHIVPLCILPFATTKLRHARLIKNGRLESVIEMFEGKRTGSGQLDIDSVRQEFGWPETPPHPDLVMLRKLGQLNSFDCYSLRIQLRENEIEVNDVEALNLSQSKRRELTNYMAGFTRPLIIEIYGGVDDSIQSFGDVLELFKQPDVERAREKLQTLADKLGIRVDDLPKFLEDYGDTYLSLSYYRQSLDLTVPIVAEFIASLDEIRSSFQFKDNINLLETCDVIESTLERLETTIAERLEAFEGETKHLWNDISARRFHAVAELIRGNYTFIGGLLCALSAKMNAWSKLFPHRRAGGLPKRAEFILSEMKQGLEKIQDIEAEVPEVVYFD